MMPLKLQRARYQLARKRPYLSSALWALIPIERPGLGSLAVDQYWRLYFDPEALDNWTDAELTGVLYHEILHLLRNHPSRLRNYPREAANIAADAEINDDLRAENISLPGTPIYPEQFGWKPGKLAEEYLDDVLNSGQEQGPASENQSAGVELEADASGSASHDSDAGSQDAADGEQSSSGSSGPDEGQRSTARGIEQAPAQNSERRPAPAQGVCGSCATGQQEPWEIGKDEAPSIDSATAELIRRQVATAIREHIKRRGEIPAHLKRWAEETLTPKVDWKRQLTAAIRGAFAHKAGAVDYTYSRPSRRQAVYPRIIFPSLRQPTPKIAVVIDTSGSISDRMLSQALAEIRRIIQISGEPITVLACDAKVHVIKSVFSPKQIDLIGGGGTDMRKGIQEALRLKPKPDVIIVLTDGYTPWPEEAPKAKVIVGLLDPDLKDEVPGWARTIVIEGEM